MIIPIWDNLKPITVIAQPAREKIIHGYFDGIFQRAGYSLVPQYTTSAKKSPTKKEKEKNASTELFLLIFNFPHFVSFDVICNSI